MREALFPIRGSRKSVVRSVRLIIDFCEEDMEGASPLLSTAYWQFELLILKDPKVDRSIMKLRAGICRFRDPFSDPHFATFWQHLNKSESSNRGEFQAGKSTTWQVLKS